MYNSSNSITNADVVGIATDDSKYSIYHPINDIRTGAENLYNSVNKYNPLPAISRFADNVYDDITTSLKTAYANTNADSILRHTMQSPLLNPIVNTAAKYQNGISAGINEISAAMPSPFAIPVSQPMYNWGPILIGTILLIVLIVWRYSKKN